MCWILENWADLGLIGVGASAIIVYLCQIHRTKKSAATTILGQITLIEKRIQTLKDDPNLGYISLYYSPSIIRENTWDQYSHLFAKSLSQAEYQLVQQFFDNAEQVEHARTDMIQALTSTWADKSFVIQQVAGGIILTNIDSQVDTMQLIEKFNRQYKPLDLIFDADLPIRALTKSLNNFNMLSGTTAYLKLQKNSYYRN